MRVPAAAALLLLLAGPASAGETTCTVRADEGTWRGLSIAVEGEEPLSAEVEEQPIAVHLASDTARVEVARPLRFDTAVPVGDVPLAPGRPLAVGDGVLLLGSQVSVTARRVGHAGALVADALWGSRVFVEAVELPCAGLDVRPTNGRADRIPSAERDSPPRVRAKGAVLPLAAGPGGEATVTLHGRIPFDLAERRDGALRVEARWDDGTRVAGWAPVSAVEAAPDEVSGRARGGGGCGAAQFATAREATLVPGASVHTRPGGPAWATAAEGAGGVVLDEPQQGFVPIYSLSGLATGFCGTMERAWVKRDSVRFEGSDEAGSDGG